MKKLILFVLLLISNMVLAQSTIQKDTLVIPNGKTNSLFNNEQKRMYVVITVISPSTGIGIIDTLTGKEILGSSLSKDTLPLSFIDLSNGTVANKIIVSSGNIKRYLCYAMYPNTIWLRRTNTDQFERNIIIIYESKNN